MHTNQQLRALKFPVVTNINPTEFVNLRHPRTLYRGGKEFTCTLSVNVGTGDNKDFTPESPACWHLTVSLQTQTSMKRAKDWSSKERNLAESCATICLLGAGDDTQEIVQYDDITYHVRRPLTLSEIRLLPDDLKAGILTTEE